MDLVLLVAGENAAPALGGVDDSSILRRCRTGAARAMEETTSIYVIAPGAPRLSHERWGRHLPPAGNHVDSRAPRAIIEMIAGKHISPSLPASDYDHLPSSARIAACSEMRDRRGARRRVEAD